MKLRGYMSVFFSLSILCICALLFAMVETARMAGAKWYLQTAVNSAVDSVMSQYHRELWDRYRLLFVEYQTHGQAADDFKHYLAPYLETDNWYPMADEETTILNLPAATDAGGDYLEAEILDYMNYGIWESVFAAEQMESLYEGGMEAEAVHEIAGSCRENTRAAWRLEEALEQLQACLEEQQSHLQNGYRQLRDYDGTGFCNSANRLIGQLDRIPGLVKTYEKRADALLPGLDESETLLAGRQEVLSESVSQELGQELQEYSSYVAKDGERRREIEGLSAWAGKQTEIVREAIAEAEEVMEILDDWDDEEEEPDRAALWGRVSRRLDRFEARLLNVAHGIQDKEKQNWLEQAETFFRLDLLAMVLPAGISPVTTMISMEELPSGGRSGTANEKPAVQALADRLLVTEYCGAFYSDFRKAAAGQSGPVAYELEYLFAGEPSEEQNLELTVRHMLLLREGWNLIHLFSDSGKRAQARELAVTIVGGTGIVPLVVITTFFILSVWALGEAIMDLRRLMAGTTVPLLKTADDWQLSLDQLLTTGQEGILPEAAGEETGLTYEEYLKFMLFFSGRETLYYRMMDIIQVNIRKKQDSFRMAHARYGIDIQQTVMNKHVFISPAFVYDYAGGTGLHYQSRAMTHKTY